MCDELNFYIIIFSVNNVKRPYGGVGQTTTLYTLSYCIVLTLLFKATIPNLV